MTAPEPIRLTPRGQLLRAVSHAIRCLNQVAPGDIEQWRRDAQNFKESIRTKYSNLLKHIPVEFDSWLEARASGLYSQEQQQQMNELLDRLSHEIRQEHLA